MKNKLNAVSSILLELGISFRKFQSQKLVDENSFTCKQCPVGKNYTQVGV